MSNERKGRVDESVAICMVWKLRRLSFIISWIPAPTSTHNTHSVSTIPTLKGRRATNTHSVSLPSVLSRMSRTVCWGFARYVKSQQKFGFDGLAKLQSILSLFLYSTLTLKNKLTVLSFHRGQSGPSPHLENISYPWQ